MQAGLILLKGARTMLHHSAYKTCVSAWLGPTLGLAANTQRHLIASASETYIDRKIRIPWLEVHGGEATVRCSRSAMPWSGVAESSSPISTSSVVLLYVKHPVGANAHDETI